jgi:hypothetical protein
MSGHLSAALSCVSHPLVRLRSDGSIVLFLNKDYDFLLVSTSDSPSLRSVGCFSARFRLTEARTVPHRSPGHDLVGLKSTVSPISASLRRRIDLLNDNQADSCKAYHALTSASLSKSAVSPSQRCQFPKGDLLAPTSLNNPVGAD